MKQLKLFNDDKFNIRHQICNKIITYCIKSKSNDNKTTVIKPTKSIKHLIYGT